jgi:hypothetical protein
VLASTCRSYSSSALWSYEMAALRSYSPHRKDDILIFLPGVGTHWSECSDLLWRAIKGMSAVVYAALTATNNGRLDCSSAMRTRNLDPPNPPLPLGGFVHDQSPLTGLLNSLC